MRLQYVILTVTEAVPVVTNCIAIQQTAIAVKPKDIPIQRVYAIHTNAIQVTTPIQKHADVLNAA